MATDPSLLFILRVSPLRDMKPILIRAFDANRTDRTGGKSEISIEVRHEGRLIFDRSQLWVGLSPLHSIDSKEARRLVLSCVAMAPGDTDRDYFKDYSPEQLEWARHWGEHLSMEAESRFGEERDRKSTRLNSSHIQKSRMPSSA